MRAEGCFTHADEQRDYRDTRAALKTYSDAELSREYLDGMRASSDRMFGQNAKKFNRLVADELLSRDISEIPNIFGAIAVSKPELKPMKGFDIDGDELVDSR